MADDKPRSLSEDSTCSTTASSIDVADPSYPIDPSLDHNQAYVLDSAQARAFAPALAEARGKQARSVTIPVQQIKDETQIKTKAEYFPQWLVPALKPVWFLSQDKVLFDGSNEVEHQMNLAYGKSGHAAFEPEEKLRSFSTFSTCSTRASAEDDAHRPNQKAKRTKAHVYDNAKAKIHAAAFLPQVCSKEECKPIEETRERKTAQWLVPALRAFWFLRDDTTLFDGENELETQLDLAYGK